MDIVIALDTYDDVFSDFDIRGYRERAISRDFLDELHIRFRKMGTEVNAHIVLLVPAQDRDQKHEELIMERMRLFFADRHSHYCREDRSTKLRFIAYTAIGLGLSFAANFLVERLHFFPLLKDFILIPSWFFVWSGLELLLKNRAEIHRKLALYTALSVSRTSFGDLEEYRGGC